MEKQLQFRAINVMLERSKGGHGQGLPRGSDLEMLEMKLEGQWEFPKPH